MPLQLEDVLGWVAVLIVSIVLMFKPWAILDPILSIGFTLFILFNVIRNLKETLLLFLQATPDAQQMEEVHKVLMSSDDVMDIHHFHIWSLDGEHSVMTVHVELNDDISVSQLKKLKEQLRHGLAGFDFVHTTIEIEFADEDCRDV
jgi:cobalt-zinc-cadmium efflux system protein